jgi:hypothetical protein
MGAIDEELKRQLSGGCDEASCIADLGGALGAQFMITGKLKRMGKRYILLLKLVDIEKVKAINTQKIMAGSPEVVADLLDSKVAELLGDEVVQVQTVGSQAPMVQGAEITAELGWLSITGGPPGSLISVKGPSGYRRSLRLLKGRPLIEQVPPGVYQWTCAHRGFVQQTGEVSVRTDQTSALNILLKPPGNLFVEGTPKGARITITGPNDFKVTKGLPIKISGVPYGRYTIVASRSGYKTVRTSKTVHAGQTTNAEINLTAVKPSALGTVGETDGWFDWAIGYHSFATKVENLVDFEHPVAGRVALSGFNSDGMLFAHTGGVTLEFFRRVRLLMWSGILNGPNSNQYRDAVRFGIGYSHRAWRSNQLVFSIPLEFGMSSTTFGGYPKTASLIGSFGSVGVEMTTTRTRADSYFLSLAAGYTVGRYWQLTYSNYDISSEIHRQAGNFGGDFGPFISIRYGR